MSTPRSGRPTSASSGGPAGVRRDCGRPGPEAGEPGRGRGQARRGLPAPGGRRRRMAHRGRLTASRSPHYTPDRHIALLPPSTSDTDNRFCLPCSHLLFLTSQTMITCTCSLIASPLELHRTGPMHQDVLGAVGWPCGCCASSPLCSPWPPARPVACAGLSAGRTLNVRQALAGAGRERLVHGARRGSPRC